RHAARTAEELVAELAVADLDDAPAVVGGRVLEAIRVGAAEAALVRDAGAVQVLAVVVDDPRHVAELAFGDVGEALEEGALAELAVAHHRPEVRLRRDLEPVVAGVA